VYLFFCLSDFPLFFLCCILEAKMQSYLAYKRFGRLARDQYERDQKRAEAMERGNMQNRNGHRQNSQGGAPGHRQSSIDVDTSSTEVPSPSTSQDFRDPEKSELPGKENGEENGNKKEDEEMGDGMERNATMSTIRTNQSFGTRMGHAMSGIEVRELSKEMTKRRSRASFQPNAHSSSEKKPEHETVFVVGYESEKDIMNPHNWSFMTRIFATIMIAAIGFIVGFASAIDSAALKQASADFGVSDVTESLATGLFLIGFGLGSLYAGPISETVGRNPVYIVTMAIYMIWIMASALAPNIGAQLVFRFLAGFFGSTPLTCAGGSLSDLWDPMERVLAFPVFANAAFMGPVIGPVVGGFIGQSNIVSWRWCEWITLIISGAVLTLIILFQPETFAPVLLKWKASHLREITGDSRYVSDVEIRADPFWKRLLHALYRPFILVAREPIVALFALYLTVVYIILFTFLEGYAYVFGETYGFSEGLTGLAFLGIAVGLCCASLLVPLIYHWTKRDLKKIREEKGPNAHLPPEKRLWFAMFGAPAIPISLFWMGWTAYSSISYWSALVASVFFGFGILCIFISTYQYIIDSYEMYAASALAALSVIRYVASGAMAEVAIP
jgi:multidrug resistance protein